LVAWKVYHGEGINLNIGDYFSISLFYHSMNPLNIVCYKITAAAREISSSYYNQERIYPISLRLQTIRNLTSRGSILVQSCHILHIPTISTSSLIWIWIYS
jgi:hypothetical protein